MLLVLLLIPFIPGCSRFYKPSQLKSEGYFTHDDNLYYVYGQEQKKDVFTLGGPVVYTLKGYKYRKLDIAEAKDSEITKEEYEKLYFGLE